MFQHGARIERTFQAAAQSIGNHSSETDCLRLATAHGRPLLKSGRRIRSFLFVVQAIAVKRAGGNAFDYSVKIPAPDSLHGNRALWRFAEADVNAVRPRSPDEKTACVLPEKHGAKFFFTRRTHGFCIPLVARRLVTFSVYTEVHAIPRTRNSLRRSLIFSDRQHDNS